MKQWFLFGILVLFSLVSTVTLSSIASDLAPTQLFNFLLAGALFYIVSKIPFQTMLQFSTAGYILLLCLLILPLLLEPIRNSHRWFSLFGILTVQPSQLAVPLFGVFLSQLLSKYSIKKLTDLLIIIGFCIPPIVLILIEPDLGTTVIFTAVILSVLFIAGIPWKYILGLIAFGIVLSLIGWNYLLKPYQKSRVTSFINPSANEAASYNVDQALIAVGSGGLFGKGLGKGSQSKLKFLPERETDFIFASFAEEFGFLGSAVLIGMYVSLLYFFSYFIVRTQEKESLFLTAALSLFLFQTSIHILMNMGMLPVTGVTLPFMSYGGSSLLSFSLLLAISHSAISQRLPDRNALHIS